jgi:hypothetical protein
MSIDRSNYEVWFIDWLDGNLNSFQTIELYNFLDLNPDLKEEFIDLPNIPLTSPQNQYPFKNTLKRTVDEISESQFEYLSAAYLENDLSDLQKSEVDEIIAKDPQKKRAFELINKIHLSPTTIKFNYKKQLLKRTPAEKIFRLTVIGLSSAAAVALIISIYVSLPKNLPDNFKNEAQVIIPDGNLQSPATEKTADFIVTSGNKHNEDAKKSENKPMLNISFQTPATNTDLIENNLEDSELRISNETGVEKIKVIQFSGLSKSSVSYDLALSYIYIPDAEPDNERSKIGKYLAKTFREKFLKEKTPPDSPLKGYEIAEAGVTGINKIFGWEMALDKKSDQNGNLKSVYFSSRILKFNAPVKKSEPLP